MSKSHIFPDLMTQAEIDREQRQRWIMAHVVAVLGVAAGIGFGALLWSLPVLAG